MSQEKIDKWFIAPLRFLKDKGYKDEGFLVLMVGIALAERVIASKRKKDKLKGKNESFEKCGADFLGLSEADFRNFWEMYRNGMMHHAQPFSGKFKSQNGGDDTFWDWDISSAYSALPEVVKTEPKKKLIRIDPWKWLDCVVQKYEEHPELVDLNDSRKLGTIRSESEAPPVSQNKYSKVPAVHLKTGSFNG